MNFFQENQTESSHGYAVSLLNYIYSGTNIKPKNIFCFILYTFFVRTRIGKFGHFLSHCAVRKATECSHIFQFNRAP